MLIYKKSMLKLNQAYNSIDLVIDCNTWVQWHHYLI